MTGRREPFECGAPGGKKGICQTAQDPNTIHFSDPGFCDESKFNEENEKRELEKIKRIVIKNPEKVRQLKILVDRQKEHHEKTGEEKYSLSDISKIIKYKGMDRLKNTIKSYIGDLLYSQIFGHRGHHTGGNRKISLNEIEIFTKEFGLSNPINRKIILIPEKVRQLKILVDRQKEHHEKTGEEKYSLSDISKIIKYKGMDRLKNTIKSYIGDLLYSQIFGHLTGSGSSPKTTLNMLTRLVKELGLSKSGIEGVITPKGIEMFNRAIKGGTMPTHAKIEVNCQIKGHNPWGAWVSELKGGRWCRRCAADTRNFTYEGAITIGLENGYYLMETQESFTKKIRNRGSKFPSRVHFNWLCENNHKNSKSYSQVSRYGCRTCYHEGRIITFSKVKKIAESREYYLAMTEKEFKDAIDKAKENSITPSHCRLNWSCKKNHTWKTSYVKMKDKAICPHCNSGYYESRTRKLFKKTFGLDFLKTPKKDVLKDGSHRNSHFDGHDTFTIFVKRIKLVFEFNGHQHYIFPNFFHKSLIKFLRQRYNDKNKVKDCKKKKVVLIVVPYTLYKLPNANANTAVINHIIKEFERQVRIFYDDPWFKFDKKDVNPILKIL